MGIEIPSFFHSKASQRRRRSFIQGIKDKENNWAEEIDDIAGVAINYFENMFKTMGCDQMEDCIAVVQHKVTPHMVEILSSEYNADEVQITLFQMGPMKSLGPDGMNALFYQKFWHIVGDDVTNVVLHFLNYGIMDPEINYTYIVLIPKIKSLKKVSDYRPISLGNVMYKIISKVLANKLKKILPQLISPT